MNILIKFPSRERPDIFKKVLSLYTSMLSGKHDIQILCSFDEDDATMNNPEMIDYLDSVENLKYNFGHNTSKIAAVNADMHLADPWDVLVLASDDMYPKIRGYDNIIATYMERFFPGLDGVLHFNDGRYPQLNTLCIFGYRWYEVYGYIYHPQYQSLWCDNEFQDVSQDSGKSLFINETIIWHGWQQANGQDELYKRNGKFYKSDEEIYHARKARGFPPECVEIIQKPIMPRPTNNRFVSRMSIPRRGH